MLRRITVALIAVAVCAAGAPSAEAGKLRSQYRGLYEKVADTHGKRAPGRNIVEDGVRTRHGARNAKRSELKQSIGVFQLKLAPPPPAGPSSSTRSAPKSGSQSWASPSTASSSSTAGGGSCGAIPGYIVQRESGGNPNARNPSGAFGCYQLMPEHFGSGGKCADLGTDQGGQDECATRLWDGGRGSSNWAATR